LHQEISNALFSPNEKELNMGKFSKMWVDPYWNKSE
jgi:hypothetical protein